MKPGQAVTVTNCDGKLLKRQVVDVIGDVVLICLDEEYEVARAERTLPWCVGFRKQYVRATEARSSKA